MPRKARTPDELRAISEHLNYEVGMFMTLARALGTDVFEDGAINNAVLESFTVHARVLLCFLFDDFPKDDDAVADDFLSGQDWAAIRGEVPAALVVTRKRVGKEIAHLTYARLAVTAESKQWAFLEIADAMERVIQRFLAAVPKEVLGPSWRHADE